MDPGAEEIGGGVHFDYPRAGALQLLGDRLRQRVFTADDDFAVKLKDLPNSRESDRFVRVLPGSIATVVASEMPFMVRPSLEREESMTSPSPSGRGVVSLCMNTPTSAETCAY